MMMFKLLFWTGCYSLLSVTEQVTAETEIFCSSEPVVSFCGSSIVLQCHLEPQQDATDNTVKWTQQSDVVHIRKGGKDDPGEQMERFEERTSLFSEGLHKGNLSLQLSSLKLSDSGRYKCSFQDGSVEKSCYVNLTVGESEVIGSPEPVTAESGQDVVLPCHLEPPFDVTSLTVEWRWNKTMVHLYRNLKDNENAQDQRFKGRTSLFHDEMHHGNISLKLKNVSEEDEGIYTCFVPKLNCQVKKGNISLNVGINDLDSTGTNTTSDLSDQKELIGLNVGGAVVVVIAAVIAGLACHKWRRRGSDPVPNQDGLCARQNSLQADPQADPEPHEETEMLPTEGAQNGQGGQQDNNQEEEDVD
ncbi:CD276 antigen homolog isoform X2 [Melanotaenia boesemani]|uniref:CD276 antigen homolog isoform X2 n=1 Tax=Melanotaenia boesemani TaxID=1250792 RepID=UPI001C04AF64|nr:CD276 antigen homolog isoform X2 [Melanotaenia boesemani]